MEESLLGIVDSSLQRCTGDPRFFDRFYEKFLASSPKVRERFAQTNFVRQKRALRGSLWMMLLAAANETKGPDRYLRDLADFTARASSTSAPSSTTCGWTACSIRWPSATPSTTPRCAPPGSR